VLEPVLLRPTEWVLARMTAGYARLLGWSLRNWGAVLALGVALIVVAAGFLYFDALGRELVPSEDQSRFVVHVVTPVGSSIGHVDRQLQECEWKLHNRDDVASFRTTVATEPGQLINEADIFVQLVPHHLRAKTQHEILKEVRKELEEIPDIRVVIRDQSTEGFTAQRGDPVDFAIQGDWKQLPGLAQHILDDMAASRLFVDMDSDYRPGMPEVRVYPNRDKLALTNVTMAAVANTLNLHVGGQRIAKYTDRDRRYDARVRLQLHQRSTPSQLLPLLIKSGDGKLVPLGALAAIQTVSTLPIVNRYNHQRKIQISASPAPGVSQGEAIARCQEIIQRNFPETGFTMVELGNAQAMRETIDSLVFALLLGIIIAYMILGV